MASPSKAPTAGSGSTAARSRLNPNHFSRNRLDPTTSACPSARSIRGTSSIAFAHGKRRSRTSTLPCVPIPFASSPGGAFHLGATPLGPAARAVHRRPRCQPDAHSDAARPVASLIEGTAVEPKNRRVGLACAKSTQDRGSEWVGSVPVFFRETRYVPGPKALGSPSPGHRPGAPYARAERFSAQRANRFRW